MHRTLSGVGWVALLFCGCSEPEPKGTVTEHRVVRGPLVTTVTERGTLESTGNIDLVAKVRAGNAKPCRATFEKVAKGMTLEQITAAVGAPPGTYARGENGRDYLLMPRGSGWTDYVQWVADDGELLVLFVDAAHHPIQPKAVTKDDKCAEVHITGVWRPDP